MERETEFWLVYTPNGSNPTVRHTAEWEAEKEAQRLALVNPSRSFYVAHVKDRYEAPCVVHTELDPYIPF